ncbi:uncharacterized protein Z520_05494 [Fonsecaea multimorphosa CBS 102226]|uniref:Xylanolytic transcriptional activator regulatory domain-containing protein n=1 Tax=Fonsecaea multimorphosa CBS 102226 TaxID=1442371 RepID=A0A0D2KQQ0_9EURO|nr:uncharacterized protein Z520_05494 [Fonsecaea multimorphosa CBS 102226]KIX99033.1 hypothetical protein Z520_05494 [Fonsecaea multimorphosa CBS 102226]
MHSPENPSTGAGVNAITGAATGELQNEGFHGMSSAASFMDSVRQAIEGQVSTEFAGSIVYPSSTTIPPIKRRLEYVLPPRTTSEELQESYWRFVYPLYPFIDRESFTQVYRSLWDGTPLPSSGSHLMRLEETTSVAIFNLVLALGCQYRAQSEAGEAHDAAEVFFNRAHSLVRFDPTDTSLLSLQYVQVMLVMSQYLTGTGNTHKAWGVIGTAIRGCHHLGLHRSAFYDHSSLSYQDKDFVRRVYHGCVMLERMVCMNLGRPVMISTSKEDPIPLPSEIHHEDASAVEMSSSTPKQSVLTFFIISTKLYTIAQQILSSFYSEENERSTQGYEKYFEGEASIFRFDRALQGWYDEVVPHLDFQNGPVLGETENDWQMTFRRQAVVLRLRFLQVRIYLFRPVFVRFCVSQPAPDVSAETAKRPCGDDLNHRVALQCCILCVKTARELIEIIHDNLATSRSWGRKPAWLYGVLHVYLSATVLLAARSKPVVTLGAISDAELHNSWKKAMHILRCFQNDSTSAKRCVTALGSLYERLSLPDGTIFASGVESTSIPPHPLATDSIQPAQVRTHGVMGDTLTDSADLDTQEVAQVFGWFDAFEPFDPSDLSWLNVIPGDFLS